METVGARVKRLREALGWSQVALAKRAGVRQQGVNALELDRVERPRYIDKIARALGTTSDYLLTGVGADPAGAMDADYVAIPRWAAKSDEATQGWMKLRRSLLEDAGLVHANLVALRATAQDVVAGMVSARDLVVVDAAQREIREDGVYLVELDTVTRLRHCARRIVDGAVVIASPSQGMPAEVVPVPQLARLRVLGRGVLKMGEL